MMKSRFSEEQIIGILTEPEAGQRTPDVCRRHGISAGTFYKWKSKYGGLEVSEAKRLKSQEDRQTRLKKRLPEAVLDKAMEAHFCIEALAEALGRHGPPSRAHGRLAGRSTMGVLPSPATARRA